MGDLAQVKTAKGYQVGQHLLLVIAGDKPTPCHVVDIELKPIDIFPPQFRATLTTDPHVKCARVITPYERAEAFSSGDLAGETVRIEAADGDVEVQVEAVAEEDDQAPARVSLDVVVGPPAEGVGYSDAYDLGAAIKEAIGQLPDRCGHIPDWLYHYDVIEIGAEVGGIDGRDRLKVKVRG
jgi:hypothetical protein